MSYVRSALEKHKDVQMLQKQWKNIRRNNFLETSTTWSDAPTTRSTGSRAESSHATYRARCVSRNASTRAPFSWTRTTKPMLRHLSVDSSNPALEKTWVNLKIHYCFHVKFVLLGKMIISYNGKGSEICPSRSFITI